MTGCTTICNSGRDCTERTVSCCERNNRNCEQGRECPDRIPMPIDRFQKFICQIGFAVVLGLVGGVLLGAGRHIFNINF